MYLNYEVRIPDVPGKINQVKKGKAIYVRYVVGRTYHPEKKYNVPDQRIIGKRSENDPEKMVPNENYVKYFGVWNSLKKGQKPAGAAVSG